MFPYFQTLMFQSFLYSFWPRPWVAVLGITFHHLHQPTSQNSRKFKDSLFTFISQINFNSIFKLKFSKSISVLKIVFSNLFQSNSSLKSITQTHYSISFLNLIFQNHYGNSFWNSFPKFNFLSQIHFLNSFPCFNSLFKFIYQFHL